MEMTKQKVWQLYPNKAVWMGSGAHRAWEAPAERAHSAAALGPAARGSMGSLGRWGPYRTAPGCRVKGFQMTLLIGAIEMT